MASQLSARHWIDGEWVDSELHAHSVNPADGETIGSYTEAGEREAQPTIVDETKRAQSRRPSSHTFIFASTYELQMSPTKNAARPATAVLKVTEKTA